MDPETQHVRFMLKEVLVKLGISQRKLAKLLGATQDWVSRLHSGKNLPSWSTAARIARALNVSVGVFLSGDPAWQLFFTRVGPGDREVPAPPPKTPRRKKAAGGK